MTGTTSNILRSRTAYRDFVCDSVHPKFKKIPEHIVLIGGILSVPPTIASWVSWFDGRAKGTTRKFVRLDTTDMLTLSIAFTAITLLLVSFVIRAHPLARFGPRVASLKLVRYVVGAVGLLLLILSLVRFVG